MTAEAGHEPNRVYIDQNGDFHLNGASFFNDNEDDIAAALESYPSLAELDFIDGAVAGTPAANKALILDTNMVTEIGYIDGVTAGTIAASKAVVVDANKDAGDFRNLTTVKTIRTPGVSATGVEADKVGSTTTGGMTQVVVEKTISPAAVETAVFTVPKGSAIRAVLANVESALTGGSTTVTWSIGTAGDPDKYGTSGFPTQADALTKDSKSSFIATPTLLTSDEAIVLTGAATGGAADGDTALTVGSVRIVIIYDTYEALANAP